MNWRQLVDVLGRLVPTGSVTTYAEVSAWGYGVRNQNQPVRSLLVGAANHDFQVLTNRVVGANGELLEIPAGADQQREQLAAEGVPFTADGRVDLELAPAVVLMQEEQ